MRESGLLSSAHPIPGIVTSLAEAEGLITDDLSLISNAMKPLQVRLKTHASMPAGLLQNPMFPFRINRV